MRYKRIGYNPIGNEDNFEKLAILLYCGWYFAALFNCTLVGRAIKFNISVQFDLEAIQNKYVNLTGPFRLLLFVLNPEGWNWWSFAA